MFPLRKLIAAATLATVALFTAPGQQAQAATNLGVIQSASIGNDYTFYTQAIGFNSVPIGPAFYNIAFTPVTGNSTLNAAFTYTPINLPLPPNVPSGIFTGGFLSWSDGTTTVTEALVAGVETRLAIPLSAAGPNQTLTVGFGSQSGFGVLAGGVSVAAIPLPASGLLLLAGLGAIAVVRRRAARLVA